MGSFNSHMHAPGNGILRPRPLTPAHAEETCPLCDQSYDATSRHRPVMTHCGHIFGAACLAAWHDDARPPTGRCPTCDETQVHCCGHRCAPRPLADHPPLAADPTLAPTCRGCWAGMAAARFRARDPLLRAAAEKRTRALRFLAACGLQLPGPWRMEVVAAALRERWERVLDESRERWEESAEGQLPRW